MIMEHALTYMTSFLALVPTAAQSLRTRQRTDVLDIDATQLIAVVLTAGSLLLAAFLTACIIGLGRQILTSNLTVHITASALDIGVQVTFWTFSHVTRYLAGVRITCVSERKSNLASVCDKKCDFLDAY